MKNLLVNIPVNFFFAMVGAFIGNGFAFKLSHILTSLAVALFVAAFQFWFSKL